MRRVKGMEVLLILFAGAVSIGGCRDVSQEPLGAPVVQRQGVQVMYVEGNPTCADLGLGQFSMKVDPPHPGTYALDERNTVTVTTEDGVWFDWTATIGVDAVIAKGGPNANVFVYDPEATRGTGLSAPRNPHMEMPYGLSHIDFCFDYEVVVGKTARTSLTRQFGWAIDKSSPVTELTLAVGQVYEVPYLVDVRVTTAADRDWKVEGEVIVFNPAPMAAMVTAMIDRMGDIFMELRCGVDFPHPMAPGETMTCRYALPLPDASDRTNHVWVRTTGPVGPGEATAPITFVGATVNPVDECVKVWDDHRGLLGTACQPDRGRFEYTLDVGPYAACGTEDRFVNRASFVTDDTEVRGDDEWAVTVHVAACPVGCTLTPGYWKTHSEYGPARHADDAWRLLPDGPDTRFFESGKTYYEVLWTPPAGNVYYILARAYAAAELNHLNEASLAPVQETFDRATTFFRTYTPATAVTLTGKLRAAVTLMAATLDQYNNGLLGTPHCSE